MQKFYEIVLNFHIDICENKPIFQFLIENQPWSVQLCCEINLQTCSGAIWIRASRLSGWFSIWKHVCTNLWLWTNFIVKQTLVVTLYVRVILWRFDFGQVDCLNDSRCGIILYMHWQTVFITAINHSVRNYIFYTLFRFSVICTCYRCYVESPFIPLCVMEIIWRSMWNDNQIALMHFHPKKDLSFIIFLPHKRDNYFLKWPKNELASNRWTCSATRMNYCIKQHIIPLFVWNLIQLTLQENVLYVHTMLFWLSAL